jgi:hypothetical protein
LAAVGFLDSYRVELIERGSGQFTLVHLLDGYRVGLIERS